MRRIYVFFLNYSDYIESVNMNETSRLELNFMLFVNVAELMIEGVKFCLLHSPL